MPRDPLLAQIHIGRQQLGLEEDDYRALLQRVTGKRSSAELSETQRRAVVDEMRRRGFKARGGRHRPGSRKPYIRLVFALWGELKRAGIWREEGIASLRSFTRKMAGVDDPEFMTYAQAEKVIEALKKMKERG